MTYNMKKFGAIMLLLVLVSACNTTKPTNTKSTALFAIGDKSISSEEFEYVYSKNNLKKDSVVDEKDIREYLDLYVNFKLKVQEAKSLGLDKKENFKTELEGYRKQLAKPYLMESKVTNQLVEEAYERMKSEVNASHILLKLDQSAAAEDTIKVYNKIIELRNKVLNGESFGTLAKEHSQDPSAKSNGGNLGYFSAMQMVFPFENAAYTTAKGAVSMPVRTQFGYHILQVHDKRASRGQIKLAHIMLRATEGMPQENLDNAKNKIDEIYKNLLAGEDWGKLCSQFSEDVGTSKKGGELPWLGTGRIHPDFEKPAFALKNSNDFTKPVKTPYGWHIIKLIDKKGIESFEKMKKGLEEKIKRDGRAQQGIKTTLKRLKSENHFVKNQENLNKSLQLADSTLLEGKWSYDKALKIGELFRINDVSFTAKDFHQYIVDKQRPRAKNTPEALMQSYYDDYEKQSLLDYENDHLTEKHKEYRMLYKEYKEGMLLFELMDQKVWSLASKDTVGLQQFFAANKENYKWQERADATIFDGLNTEVIQKLQNLNKRESFIVSSMQITDFSVTEKEKLEAKMTRLKSDENSKLLVVYSSGNETLVNSIIDVAKNKGFGEGRILKELADKDGAEVYFLSNSKDNIQRIFNKENPLALQIESGKFEKNDNDILKELEWKKGISTIVEKNGRHFWVKIKDILPADYKGLDEIKGLVISDYQDQLEKELVKDLKVKYPVKINNKQFEKVITRLKK